LITNQVGEYNVVVTNTVNGCVSSANMTVVDGTLSPGIEPDRTSGYAPLTVVFKNTSTSSLGNSSITSVWSFGNGGTATLSSAASTSVTYNSPGTYTVQLFVGKGNCIEKTSKVIQVEIPSEIEIPNVFTPNGDGINDVYHLSVSKNLSEIKISIFDRWGQMVYELTTPKGNIAWDGKNQYGVEVAEGTYFYILTAKGNDGANYENKGTINLMR
jgi:gliding motility-associated-like protein